MSRQTLTLTSHLHEYLLEVSLREADILRRLREETARMPGANMQIAPEQGQFMQMLVRIAGARRIIEVGVFTGYSSLAMALAMPPDGHLLACDVNDESTGVARRYWAKAGVAGRISLRIAPALETLQARLDAGEAGQWDLAFIDADKESYAEYYALCLALLRPGGLILFDNVLWGGAVADPERDDADTRALRALNRQLHADDRIELSMVPIGDGLTIVRKC